MDAMAFQITSLMIAYSAVYSDADQRKPGPVNSPHKWPVTRKKFPFDDVTMTCVNFYSIQGLMTTYLPAINCSTYVRRSDTI